MRVVKDGAGTVRLSKTNQRLFGGVEILGGTVLVGTTNSTASAYLGVRGSEIVVRGDNSGAASATSGVLDFGGVDGYTGYRIVLDGGAMHNAALANVTDLRLDSDSWIKTTTTTAANGTNYIGRADSPSFVDMGGHALSARVASGRTLYLYNVTLDNGLVNVVEGGWFGTRGDNVATNASLRTNCGLDVNGTFQKVSNGTCLISWDVETAPDSTVKFVRADEGRSYGLVRQDDGLYVLTGFMLIVR